MNRTRLFLSYARTDGLEACGFFARALQEASFRVWRDISDIPGGVEWHTTVRETIPRVDAVLVFLTPAAVASEAVEFEWRIALAHGKRVVPLLISPCSIPAELRTPTYRDLTAGYENEPVRIIGECEREWQSIQDSFHDLSGALDDLLRKQGDRDLFRELEKSLGHKLAADPPALPPEVCRAVFETVRFLARELSAERDISEHLDQLLNGIFRRPSVNPGVWPAHADTFQRIFRPVRGRLPGISVPVVPFVMTRAEAQSLVEGTAFDGYPAELRQEFETFRGGLPEGWQTRYQDNREGMIAFGESQSIGQRLRTALRLVRRDECKEPLLANFEDPLTLERDRLWTLRSTVCVVVVDAISTRHPAIQRRFRRSYLDSSPTTLVVRVSPNGNTRRAAPTMNALVEEWFTSEFQSRLENDDRRCAEVSDWDGFRRWVRVEVPRSIPKCSTKDDSILAVMNQVGR
jgi:TIR domain